jgi:hypothetical protein
MPTINLNSIDVGGPCKLSDNGSVIYFDGGVKITPQPVWRQIESAVAGQQDDVLVDLTYKITGTPRSVWNSTYQGVLLPAALTNWNTAGARLIGATNRPVNLIGTDANGFNFTRAILTKMPELNLGLGGELYGEAEWTAFIGNGKALTDSDAFYTQNTTAWDQSDYPTTHQESLCTAAWGGVSGWDTVFAEKGFKLTHELQLDKVAQGNVTLDLRVNKYRGMMSFAPEQPTTAELLAAFGLQGGGAGIGMRRSSNANDFVVAGPGISVTLKSAGLNKGEFVFDNKANRHGEFAMITALTAPGTRLALG